MSNNKDSTVKTIVVALLLCIVCSVMVAGTVQFLKPRIITNKDLDVKKNILIAAGYVDGGKAVSADKIESLFNSCCVFTRICLPGCHMKMFKVS